MVLRRLMTVGALAVGLAFPTTSFADWWGWTTTGVNFRVSPGGDVYGHIPGYTRVRVDYCQGNWCRVYFDNYWGWVWYAYISRSQPYGGGGGRPAY